MQKILLTFLALSLCHLPLQSQCNFLVTADSISSTVDFTPLTPDTAGYTGNYCEATSQGSYLYYTLQPLASNNARITFRASCLGDHGVFTVTQTLTCENGAQLAMDAGGQTLLLLNPGDSIHAGLNWQTDTLQTQQDQTGNFLQTEVPVTNGYFAVRFPYGGEWKYGWVKFELANHSPGLELILKSFAFGSCSPLAVQSSSPAPEFLAYPNPSTGEFTLEMNHLLPGEYLLVLYDDTGKMLSEETFAIGQGDSIRYDLELNQPTGMYFLRLLNDKTSLGVKILLNSGIW